MHENVEEEILQPDCYGSFFSMRVTWKLTVNRPAGRRKDANKKDIYRRRALSSPLDHSRPFCCEDQHHRLRDSPWMLID